jgi:hypothetical protein
VGGGTAQAAGAAQHQTKHQTKLTDHSTFANAGAKIGATATFVKCSEAETAVSAPAESEVAEEAEDEQQLEETLDPDQRDHLNARQRLTVAKLGFPSAANRDQPWLNYDIVNLIGSFVRDGYGYGYGPRLYGPRYGARLYGARYGPRYGPQVVVEVALDDPEQQAAAEAAEVARYGPRLYGSRYFPHGPQVVVEEAEDDPE